MAHCGKSLPFGVFRVFLERGPTRAPPRLCRSSEMVRALTRGTNGMWGVGWDRSGAIPGLCGVSQSRTCRLCCRQLSDAVGAQVRNRLQVEGRGCQKCFAWVHVNSVAQWGVLSSQDVGDSCFNERLCVTTQLSARASAVSPRQPRGRYNIIIR